MFCSLAWHWESGIVWCDNTVPVVWLKLSVGHCDCDSGGAASVDGVLCASGQAV